MSGWTELLRAKASIYALDEQTKQWNDRGSSGQFVMYQNNQFPQDVRIKLSKNKKESWWRLINGVLKPKGERAWVLKGWSTTNNIQEIIAIRFSDISSSQTFAEKYNILFPPHLQQPIFQYQPQAAEGQYPGMAYQAHTHNKGPWECAVCTFSNDATRPSCSMCGLSADASAKARLTGQVINNNNKLNNNANNAAQGMAWCCISCTFVNTATALVCGVCGAKKPLLVQPPTYIAPMPPPSLQQQPPQQQQQQPVPPPQIPRQPQLQMAGSQSQEKHNNIRYDTSSSWICPICTLQNDGKANRCEACQTSRGMGLVNNNSNTQKTEPVLQRNKMPMVVPPQQQMMMMMNNKPPPAVLNDNNMNNNSNGTKQSATIQELQRAASDIACYNDNPSSVFATLRSVTKKLLRDDIRYRTLDTTNPKVMERLMGFEGVLEFLMLVGFESDEMGMKLVCEQKPTKQLVRNAIEVLNSYERRLGIGKKPKKKINVELGSGNEEEDTDQGGVTPDDITSNGVTTTTKGGPGSDVAVNGVQPQQQQKEDDDAEEEDTLTLEQIILWSTHESLRDNDTMKTLIITHKSFTDSLTLLKQLQRRFFVPIPRDISNDEEKVDHFRKNVQKSIQLKVIKALRDWMKLYWDEDFSIKYSESGEEMQQQLLSWIVELNKTATTDTDAKWIKQWADAVNKEFERFKLKGGGDGISQSINQSSKYKRIKLNIDQDTENLLDYILPIINDDTIECPTNPVQISQYLSVWNGEELANQITLLDHQIFSAIEARECIGQSWKKKNNKKLAPHILGMIQQFNNLTLFVQIQILRERSLKERSKTMKNVIKMGERFKNLRNYNSLCAIYSALNSAPIHRLKLAWKRVPEKYINMYENFKNIFSREFNHRNLRQLFNNAPAPSIPHIGLFLQDLVFIDDGNSTKIQIANFKQHGDMVNFNKCVRITDRIKNIRLYQTHPYITNDDNGHDLQNNLINIKMKNDPILQKLLLLEFKKLQKVTEDQIWDMSDIIKKQDERDAKKAIF